VITQVDISVPATPVTNTNTAATYLASGSATRTITPASGVLERWGAATVLSVTPANTSAAVTYSADGSAYVADPATLPASQSLYVKVQLSSADTSATPSVRSLSVAYVPAPPAPTPAPAATSVATPSAATATSALTVRAINGLPIAGIPVISAKPTFSGYSPAGSTVTVIVHSDPVSCMAVAAGDGSWSCTLARETPLPTSM
jgi:hypothetical protein